MALSIGRPGLRLPEEQVPAEASTGPDAHGRHGGSDTAHPGEWAGGVHPVPE